MSSAEVDPLELTTLDSASLFRALTAVEKAIPELLSHLKPILAQLLPSDANQEDEQRGVDAAAGVIEYLNLLDRIQFVLRQTVYYLRETKASPNTLLPPPIDNIPTPFAASLPTGTETTDGEVEGGGGQGVELGLYGSRIEARTLREIVETLRELRLSKEKDVLSDQL